MMLVMLVRVLVLVMRGRVLLLTRDCARHVRKVRPSGTRERKQTAELLRLIGGLLVRVRVLLEALDAVLHLWPPEPREEDACIVARDVHHRRIKSEVAVLGQHASLID